MGFDDLAKSTAVQVQHNPQQMQQGGGYYDDGYGYDNRYPIPNDPYMGARPQSTNVMMMTALLDSKLKDGSQLDDVTQMFIILVDNVKRIPNIEMTVVKSLHRDMMDIIELSECQGTRLRVLSMMKDLLFEINTLGAYGGAELRGISTIGAMVTQKQIADQTVKYPQEPAQRKKLFGVF